MKIFTREEIEQFVKVDLESIQVVEQGFVELARGNTITPPILRVGVEQHNGEVDVKTAYVKGYEMFCIKVSSGFFNNKQLGLPTGNGMMLLICARTGAPKAIFLDNGYLTDVRTAAAGAIAAKHLASDKVKNVVVIGAGSQAEYQVKALAQVRLLEKVFVYANEFENSVKLSKKLEKELNLEAVPIRSLRESVEIADLVITATPSKDPVLKGDWLKKGVHVTAMGSDAEHKRELDQLVITKADRLVCDVKAQAFQLGEYHHASVKEDAVVELGEAIINNQLGRTTEEEITVCDLTGTGVQDTMIALYAYKMLIEAGLGLTIEN
ncbi:cyclodeaminase [Halalkalibacter okhensis]|uniref:Ectoine utilization protein EutC n=1 Tax=Halalkalibacter okhensis TaxID=333138 RepID=A0A0B0IFN4_9BACI|nr:cyclodeaminase [Halalkalibacter okhensis]KHF38481.1 ectoine utilization protein EutC [Halalkalibacter okhensis]